MFWVQGAVKDNDVHRSEGLLVTPRFEGTSGCNHEPALALDLRQLVVGQETNCKEMRGKSNNWKKNRRGAASLGT